MPAALSLSGRRVATLAVAAAALHGAFDAVSYVIPWATPPYLRLQDAPEAFQVLSPLAVSIAGSCVSGVIGMIAVVALEPAHRRPIAIAVLVTGFWLFSAALMRLAWLSTPWSQTATALVCGVPRGAVIGWVLAQVATRPCVSASRGEAA